MKTILAFLLISLTSMASDYDCQARFVKMQLKLDGMNTSLTVRDIQTGQFYYNGIISEVIARDGLSDLMFETQSRSFLQLRFKTEALDKGEAKIFGFAKGYYGGGFVDQSIVCFKKEDSHLL